MKKWKIILSLCFFPLLLQGCNLQDNTDSVQSTNNGSPYLVSKYEYQETKTINFKNKVKETQKITQTNIQDFLGDTLQADTFSNVSINPDGLILSTEEYNGVIHFLILNGYFLKEINIQAKAYDENTPVLYCNNQLSETLTDTLQTYTFTFKRNITNFIVGAKVITQEGIEAKDRVILIESMELVLTKRPIKINL